MPLRRETTKTSYVSQKRWRTSPVNFSLKTDKLLRSTRGNSSRILWAVKDKKAKASEGLKFACFVFTWMENFLYIRSKEGTIIPFRMNTAQQIMAQFVADRWHRELPVLLWLLKSRQQGSSTFWQLLFLALCELREGYRVSVVAHDEVGSREVFSRAFTAIRQIRKREEWPDFDLLTEQGGHILWASESSMQSATIKTGDAIGKGGTNSAVHYSESASFSDRGINAKKAVSSLEQSIPNNRWTIKVHESTAKGKDPFFWPGCEMARDPNSGSAWSLIFLPWFLSLEYQMSWAQYRKALKGAGKPDPGTKFEPTEEEDLLVRKLANVRVRKGEERFRYRFQLSTSQLIWRRFMIDNACQGDPDEFKRYYPSFYEEAFTASAACYFDETSIDWYRQRSSEPLMTGVIMESHIGAMFQRHRNGPIKIWKLPRVDEEYVLAADPGGEKRNSDPYNCYVMHKHDHEVVAQIHGHFEWDLFADMCHQLGLFYNKALVVVENNHRPAIAQRLHRNNYPKLYYYFEKDTARAKAGRTPGYNLNIKTRKALLDVIARAVRTRSLVMPDSEFWREMQDFVWVPKPNATNPDVDGTYKAIGKNHDDRIITIGLALLQCPTPEFRLTMPELEIPESFAFRMLKKFQKDDEDKHRGGFLSLGATN